MSGWKYSMDRLSLVRLLADGKFHSGETLAQLHGVTRTQVWKQIQDIKKVFNLDVQSVRGRGYRLAKPIELLDTATILTEISDRTAQHLSKIELFQTLDSTNNWMMAQAISGQPCATACFAEQQTQGRGRYGRQWISPFGNNIYFSMLWRYALSPSELSGLSLAVGVAVLRVLRDMGLTGVGLKWPNDILWGNRKLAGLLLEVAGESSGPSHVVVGIGINVRLTSYDAKNIDQPWVDIETITGSADISRNRLAAKLLDNLIEVLRHYDRTRLEPYLSEWREFDLYYGQPIIIKSGSHVMEGVHHGINSDGALLISMPDGLKSFHAGEVSLRSAG